MSNKENVKFFPMGKQAILMTWLEEVNPKLLQKLLDVMTEIQKQKRSEIFEVINTYNALLINYKKNIKDFDIEVDALKKILTSSNKQNHSQQKIYHLPICYDEKFGWDLEKIAKQKEIDISTIIKLHSAPTYTVYFTGFLPGFPYLGGLPEELHVNRRANPRKRISEGAVGIGGNQTGIYPSSSPGGWQLIGNCPIPLFDISNQPPCLFKSGDQIKFESVSIDTYNNIKSAIKNQTYHLKSELCP